MAFLVRLPDGYLMDMFSQWSDCDAIGKLDTSFCSIIDRSWFLDLIGGDKISFQPGSSLLVDDPFEVRYNSWLVLRKVKVRLLNVWNDSFRNGNELKHNVDTSFVEEVNIFELPDDVRISSEMLIESQCLLDFLNSCPRLTAFEVSRIENFTNNEVLFKLNEDILQQLTFLGLDGSG